MIFFFGILFDASKPVLSGFLSQSSPFAFAVTFRVQASWNGFHLISKRLRISSQSAVVSLRTAHERFDSLVHQKGAIKAGILPQVQSNFQDEDYKITKLKPKLFVKLFKHFRDGEAMLKQQNVTARLATCGLIGVQSKPIKKTPDSRLPILLGSGAGFPSPLSPTRCMPPQMIL